MDDVFLNMLRTRNNIANEPGIFWHRNPQRIFHGTHRRQGMHRGADTADSLGPDPCLARVASAQDLLEAPENGAETLVTSNPNL